MLKNTRLYLLLGIALLIQSGCDAFESQPDAVSENQEAGDHLLPGRVRVPAGVVYTMTNAAEGNAVILFNRNATGRLTSSRSYDTGGEGSGDGLNGTSNPLILSKDNRFLLAVNGGSDEISVFLRYGRSLALERVVPSGGERPISITMHDDVIYVLNVGRTGPGNIMGFRLGSRGTLREISGSRQPLNPGAGSPSQIGFTPDGRFLVITDKPTNTITTYAVDGQGIAGPPQPQASTGETPFGFGFTPDGILVVSEAFGGATDASATSSYRIMRDGTLQTISPSVLTTESAACWADVTDDGRFAYVTNTGSGTVTGYAVDRNGALTLLDANGETGMTGAGSSPVDMAIVGSAFLYVHNSGTQEIIGFVIDPQTGALTPLRNSVKGGLPATAVGVAAF